MRPMDLDPIEAGSLASLCCLSERRYELQYLLFRKGSALFFYPVFEILAGGYGLQASEASRGSKDTVEDLDQPERPIVSDSCGQLLQPWDVVVSPDSHLSFP